MAVVVVTPDSGFKSNLSRKFNTSPADGFSKSSGSINTHSALKCKIEKYVVNDRFDYLFLKRRSNINGLFWNAFFLHSAENPLWGHSVR